jgi:hypothetical protein
MIDKILDMIEDYAEASPSQWDNLVILPACKAVRKYLDIPDNDNV